MEINIAPRGFVHTWLTTISQSLTRFYRTPMNSGAYKFLLAGVAAGILFVFCSGCCTYSLWCPKENDDPNGFCLQEISKTVFTADPEKSEVTLVADIVYRTQLTLFPGVHKQPFSSSWNQWGISCGEQQSATFSSMFFQEYCRKNTTANIYTVDIAEKCVVTRLTDLDGKLVEKTVQTHVPRAEKRKDGLLCVAVFPLRTASVHPADAAMLKAAPFFLLREKGTDIYTVGCVDGDRLVQISNYGLVANHCGRYRLAEGWITAWKVAVTPLNIVADVVTLPWQICGFILIKIYLPSDLC